MSQPFQGNTLRCERESFARIAVTTFSGLAFWKETQCEVCAWMGSVMFSLEKVLLSRRTRICYSEQLLL